MEYIPVVTPVLTPPQADLLAVLDESLPAIVEGDIVVVSSKVVAIHEGRCVPMASADKKALVDSEADIKIPRTYWGTPLTVTRHAFIGAAGIDESNGDGFYILLPEGAFLSAEMLYEFLKKKYQLHTLGVVITDSASSPLRYGAKGIAIGWWGFEPLQDHIGREDLFGRKMVIERSNLVDGIAAGATVVSGEVNECVPVVIARNVPRVKYVEGNTKDMLFSPYSEDTFRVLYEQYLP